MEDEIADETDPVHRLHHHAPCRAGNHVDAQADQEESQIPGVEDVGEVEPLQPHRFHRAVAGNDLFGLKILRDNGANSADQDEKEKKPDQQAD